MARNGIFISYRRGADSGFAHLLYDKLVAAFGKERIFFDVDRLEIGEDYVAAIDRRLADTELMVVLIGPGWLSATDDAGRPRLESPTDFCRLEVEHALNSDVKIVPLLAGGARMPAPQALPPTLSELVRRQAFNLGEAQATLEAARFVETLKERLSDDARRRQPTSVWRCAETTKRSFFSRARRRFSVKSENGAEFEISTRDPVLYALINRDFWKKSLLITAIVAFAAHSALPQALFDVDNASPQATADAIKSDAQPPASEAEAVGRAIGVGIGVVIALYLPLVGLSSLVHANRRVTLSADGRDLDETPLTQGRNAARFDAHGGRFDVLTIEHDKVVRILADGNEIFNDAAVPLDD